MEKQIAQKGILEKIVYLLRQMDGGMLEKMYRYAKALLIWQK